MFLEPYWENIVIYGENLSSFYLVCALVSFLAVWLTWYANLKPELSSPEEEEDLTQTSSIDLNMSDDLKEEVRKSKAHRRAFRKSMEESLTFDDRTRESEAEKKQLLDIFKLMKKDKKLSSMTLKELQEQLKLYRD